MMDSFASNNASALYSLLLKEERPAYLSALSSIKDDLEKEEKLSAFLSSYAIPLQEKEKILETLYGKMPLKHLLPFLRLIVSKHRISRFSEICLAFESLCNEENQIKDGLVYSAFPLSQKQIASLEEAMGKKTKAKVRLRYVNDPGLLGGIKVALDGKVYDGSLRGKLQEIERMLKGGETS